MPDNDKASIAKLLTLSDIFRAAIFSDGYSFPVDFANAIALTPPGEEWLIKLRTIHEDLTDADGKAALVGERAAEDCLLVDLDRTDFSNALSIFERELNNTKGMRLPYIYGREIDDAYISLFGSEPRERLTPEESQALLDKTPPGVFQVGTITIGPLGLVECGECRLLTPTPLGPIVFCTDPGCNAQHRVLLQSHKVPAVLAYWDILPTRSLTRGFSSMLRSAIRPGSRYSLDYPGTLPQLLTNGFSASERSTLLRNLLAINADNIREFTNQAIPGSRRRSPAEIVNRLGKSEALQLLLMATNATLVKQLEMLIDSGEIHVGASEVRLPFMARSFDDGARDVKAQAGQLGVRFTQSSNSTAPLRLRVFLRTLFGDSIEDLDWDLRGQAGRSAFEKLDHYLRSAELTEVIKGLVLKSRSRVLRAIEILPFGFMQIPQSGEEEEKFIRTLLWKLGDALPAPRTVESEMKRLLLALDSSIDRKEAQVGRLALEALRSAGVSLFVELESVLTSCVDYASWLLLNDHFGLDRTHRFMYSRKRAREFAVTRLNATSKKPEDFVWKDNGENTLGTLAASLRVLADECERVLNEQESYARDANDYPFFATDVDTADFPFRHTALICDLTDDSALRLIEALRSASGELERGRVAEVRNDFSHSRENFPAPAVIGAAVDAVSRSIDLLVGDGLLPTISVLASTSTDALGRSLTQMVDGAGRIIRIYDPSPLYFCDLPSTDRPQIITVGAVIGLQPIRLAVDEGTEFTHLWDSYPTVNDALDQAAEEVQAGSDDTDLLDAPKEGS